MDHHHKTQKSKFNKIAIIFVIFLFGIIIFLSLFVFNLFPFTSPRTKQKNPPKIAKTSEETSTMTTIISSGKPKTFSNISKLWEAHTIPNAKIKVLSPLKISASMFATFEKDAPASSSAGITFSNGLEEKDPNVRKISIYYYLKNQEWILKYQSGKTVTYAGLLSMPKEKAQGTFSLLIASNGKNVLVTTPNTSTRLIHFPQSLYDVTNHMALYALTGPYAQTTISSLRYEAIQQ